MMWRRSRCMVFNTSLSFGRQLLVTGFDNPMPLSLSQVIIPAGALNIYNHKSNSSLYYNYYYSVVVSPRARGWQPHEPMRFMPNFQRMFMSDDTTTSSSNDNENRILVVVDKHREPLDEEKVNNLLSMLANGNGGGCFDTIAESSEEYREILLNHNFFLRVMDIDEALEDIFTEEIWVGYLKWVFSRDDFKMDNIILSKIIYRFSGPPSVCHHDDGSHEYLGAEGYLVLIWRMMQRRRVEFKREGVVTTQLLNHMLWGLSFPPILGLSDHSLISIEILDSMFEQLGCVPDFDSYVETALCCFLLEEEEDPRLARICQDMCDIIRTQTQPIDVSRTIRSFCLQRKLKLAHAVYVAAKDRLEPPLQPASVFYLIRLLSSYNSYKDKRKRLFPYKDKDKTRTSYYYYLCLAVDMLAGLSSESRSSKGSAAAFSAVVIALCNQDDVHSAKKLVAEMILKGPPPGIKAFNPLIKSLCLTGDLEGAFHMLQLTESRGLKPDLGSYRLLIKGYKKRGMMDQASTLMSMATHKHPNSTFKV